MHVETCRSGDGQQVIQFFVILDPSVNEFFAEYESPLLKYRT